MSPSDIKRMSEPAGAPALPNLNTGPYPFDTVVRLLEDSAFLDAYAFPSTNARTTIFAPDTGVAAGFRIDCLLNRFQIRTYPPKSDDGLRGSNTVAERVGNFADRWIFMPDYYAPVPGQEIPASSFDPSRQQRFAMLDSRCMFESGAGGFRGFGTGMTFPMATQSGSGVNVAAVGNIEEGFGRLAGKVGVYTCCGTVSENGFEGSVLCRIADPQGGPIAQHRVPGGEDRHALGLGATWLLIRGRRKNEQSEAGYWYGPDGTVNGLMVEEELRILEVDFAVRRGLSTETEIGAVIGSLVSHIRFNPLAQGPPGTADAPIPYQSENHITIVDASGKIVGGFETEIVEGRNFVVDLANAPELKSLRFGGFGRIMNGTGEFSGIDGFMIDNSAVSLGPFAPISTYLFRILDPAGKYRAGNK